MYVGKSCVCDELLPLTSTRPAFLPDGRVAWAAVLLVAWRVISRALAYWRVAEVVLCAVPLVSSEPMLASALATACE